MLQKFLEKTKKKSAKSKDFEGESDLQTSEGQPNEEQEKLRKRVSTLMKKQKVFQVRGLVKAQDESKPWGQENHVKVRVVSSEEISCLSTKCEGPFPC